MSFQHGKASKDKELLGKKSQFYVEFLGWMETRGLRGQRYTEPVIRELRRRQGKMGTPPRLTIQVSRKELKISQEVEDKKKKTTKKIKFPNIPGRDVTFVHQACRPVDGRPDDVVACIFLGYMPRTERYVHVHVYRLDSAGTASAFAAHMSAIAGNNTAHVADAERHLAAQGEIEDPRLGYPADGMSEPRTTDSAVGSASSGYSDEEDQVVSAHGSNSPTFDSQEIDPDLQSLRDVQPFDNVADELRFRMKMGDAPLLLPPKDYDTISRAHGNLQQVNQRRCLNLNIVGDQVLNKDGNNNNNDESGVDMASPASTNDSKNTADSSPGPVKPGLFAPDLPSPGFAGGSAASSHSGDSNSLNRRQGSGGLVSWAGPNSNATTPGTPPLPSHLASDMVYPPKVASPPMSPRLYRQAVGNRIMQRQNSATSDNSARYSDQDIAYNAASNGDLYAIPFKGSHGMLNQPSVAADDVPPADYLDDDEVSLRRGPGSRGNSRLLTRSMPSELIRSEMALGGAYPPNTSSRPASGEIRGYYRGDGPAFVGGGRTGSPAFGGRTDSPSFRGSGRVSSPAFVGRVDSPSFRGSSQNFGPPDAAYVKHGRVHNSKR